MKVSEYDLVLKFPKTYDNSFKFQFDRAYCENKNTKLLEHFLIDNCFWSRHTS